MKTINILDCTLRDGGYYNNWDFPKTLVNEYLKAVSESGIRNVEIGFRSLKENKLNGYLNQYKSLMVSSVKSIDFFKSNFKCNQIWHF